MQYNTIQYSTVQYNTVHIQIQMQMQVHRQIQRQIQIQYMHASIHPSIHTYIYIIIYICTYVQPSCTLDLARGRGPWPWPWPVAVARVRQLVFLWRSHDDVVLRGRKLGPLVPFGRDPALQGDTLEITISLDVAYGLYIYIFMATLNHNFFGWYKSTFFFFVFREFLVH